MVRIKMVCMATALAVLISGCGGKSDIAQAEQKERGSALYRQAFAAEQAGNLDEAIRLFNKVLIEEPHSFSAHFQLATLLHDHAEDYIGAIYHYKQYLYLRPDSEKSTLAQERIRIAEQLLAPQLLRKVGDSVQGISQAHLLNENDRLNRIITKLEGEKSVLLEAKTTTDAELARLKTQNDRLHDILTKMRISDTVSDSGSGVTAKQAAKAVRQPDAGAPDMKTDAKTLRALRAEAEALSAPGGSAGDRKKPLADIPSTEAVLKEVKARFTGGSEKSEPVASAPAATAAAQSPKTEEKPKEKTKEKSEEVDLSSFSMFGKSLRKRERERESKPKGELRTYVVQPGDSLFRVSEKFYGDATKWKKIRDANRAGIDPDGRIRAGQIIVIP